MGPLTGLCLLLMVPWSKGDADLGSCDAGYCEGTDENMLLQRRVGVKEATAALETASLGKDEGTFSKGLGERLGDMVQGASSQQAVIKLLAKGGHNLYDAFEDGKHSILQLPPRIEKHMLGFGSTRIGIGKEDAPVRESAKGIVVNTVCPGATFIVPGWRQDAVHIGLLFMFVAIFAVLGIFAQSDAAGYPAQQLGLGAAPEVSSIGDLHTSLLQVPSLTEIDQAIAGGEGVLGLIRKQSSQQPDKVALIDGRNGSSVTYSHLLELVSSLTAMLAEARIGQQDVVALYLPSGPELVVATLAVNNAEAAWVVLDPKMPNARNHLLQRDSCVRLALASALGETPDSGEVPLWVIGVDGAVHAKGTLPQPLPCKFDKVVPPGTTSIIYTSGSSGIPKGVMWGMEGWLQETMMFKQMTGMDSSSLLLMKGPSIWASVLFELFTALVAGGTVYCDPQCLEDLDRLAKTLSDHPISVTLSSAPIMRALVEDIWSASPHLLANTAKHLRHIVPVGGALPLDCCSLFQAAMPRVFIHNCYACTESGTVAWTYQPCPGGPLNSPAGVPWPGMGVLLMDSMSRPVPIGQEGEVYITTHAIGYLGDPDLTLKRFHTAPDLGVQVGKTMYQTGDVGRLTKDPSGVDRLVLSLTGRADRQLNIHGVRVFPEEIEAAISDVPGVAEVAVVGSGSTIVAFISAKPNATNLIQEIKDRCVGTLMPRMRPHVIVELNALPKLANRKTDLMALMTKADKVASDEIVEALDSLGKMRKVSREKSDTLETFMVARGLGMIAVIIYHWAWLCRGSDGVQSHVPQWLVPFIFTTCSNDWGMNIFVIMSGFTDRQDIDERKPEQWREVMLVSILWMASWYLIPQTLQFIADTLGDDTTLIQSSSHVSWYLVLWLVCRFLSTFMFSNIEAACRKVSTPALYSVRVSVVLTFLCAHNLLSNYVSKHSGYIGDYYRLQENGQLPIFLQQDLFASILKCFINQWENSFVCLYVVVWFLGKDVYGIIRSIWPSFVGSGFIWCFVTVVLFQYVGMLDVRDGHYDVAYCQHVMRDICMASMVLGVSSVISGTPWAGRCVFLAIGRYSLGGYVLHMFFMRHRYHVYGLYGFKAAGIPDIVEAMDLIRPWFGGIGQLAVLLAYPVIFSLSLGMGFQKAFLAILSAVGNGVAFCYNRVSLAVPRPCKKV